MSEPAARLRQPFDLDDFERRLRGTSTGPVSGAATSAGAFPGIPEAAAPAEDPLAELARLVEGSRDAFSRAVSADRSAGAQGPREGTSNPAFQYSAPRAVPPMPTASLPRAVPPDFHDDSRPAQQPNWNLRGAAYDSQPVDNASGIAGGGYGARDLDAGQPAWNNPPEQSWNDQPRDQGQEQAWAQEQYDGAQPPRRSRLALYAMTGALCLVVTGIGATVLMRGGHAPTSETPTIKAVSGPLKIVPEATADAGDASRPATVLDRAGDHLGSSRMVSSEEQPVELSQVRSQPSPGAMPTTSPVSVSGAPVRTVGPTPGSAFPEPIRVKTVSVRPDGTIIQNDPGAGAALQPAPRPTATAPGAGGVLTTASTPAVPKPATPKSTARAVTTPASPMSASEGIDAMAQTRPGQPIQLTPTRPAAASTVAPARPVVTASAEPARPNTAPASRGAGTFAVQLAAAGSDAEAHDKAGKFEHQFASAMAGHHASIIKGDANGKSVWRIRVGGLSREAAVTMCTQIKGNGGACFVAAN